MDVNYQFKNNFRYLMEYLSYGQRMTEDFSIATMRTNWGNNAIIMGNVPIEMRPGFGPKHNWLA